MSHAVMQKQLSAFFKQFDYATKYVRVADEPVVFSLLDSVRLIGSRYISDCIVYCMLPH